MEVRGEVKKGSEYSIAGNCAHDVAAACLDNGSDAWEHVGWVLTKDGLSHAFTADDAVAVQQYLDTIRALSAPLHKYVEVSFHCPEIHPQFYGQSDYVGVTPDRLDVWDYKHGVGIAVDAEHNSQLLMYAAGVIHFLRKHGAHVPERVRLNICQPRAFHPAGPVRQWETTSQYIDEWVRDEWLPGAARTRENNPEYMAGEWCRFCPAKLNCPLMAHKIERVRGIKPAEVRAMTDEQLAELNYDLKHIAFVRKAAADETFSRLMNGRSVSGSKLVHAKTDRVWKEGSEPELLANFGNDLYEQKIKSPAVVEKMPGGKVLVRKLAYKPEGKMTVADADDVRSGQKARNLKEVFGLTE